MEGFDLGPLFSMGVEGVAAVLGVVASWALKRVADLVGVKRESDIYQQTRDRIEELVAAGERRAKRAVDDTTVATFDNRDIINQAVDTMLTEAPKWLRELGWDRERIESIARDALS